MRKRQQQQQQSHSGLYENYSRHLCCHKEGPPCLYLYSVAPGMLNSYENKQKIYTWMGGRRTLSFLFHCRIAFRKVIEHRRPIDCCDASPHSSTTRSAKCPRAHSIFNYILFSVKHNTLSYRDGDTSRRQRKGLVYYLLLRPI
jgi:hypothetical protein